MALVAKIKVGTTICQKYQNRREYQNWCIYILIFYKNRYIKCFQLSKLWIKTLGCFDRGHQFGKSEETLFTFHWVFLGPTNNVTVSYLAQKLRCCLLFMLQLHRSSCCEKCQGEATQRRRGQSWHVLISEWPKGVLIVIKACPFMPVKRLEYHSSDSEWKRTDMDSLKSTSSFI